MGSTCVDLCIDDRGDRSSVGSDARTGGEREWVGKLLDGRCLDELLRAFVELADLVSAFGELLAKEGMYGDTENEVAADMLNLWPQRNDSAGIENI